MSDICKNWYKSHKKRYEENIHLWNTDKEACSKAITGHDLNHNAWRMIKISGAVDRMGGFANFSYYVNKCAETDYQCFDEKVQQENQRLKELLKEACGLILKNGFNPLNGDVADVANTEFLNKPEVKEILSE